MLRHYPEPGPRLIGYDPAVDLARDHLARLVEMVVEQSVQVEPGARRRGQPAFDPRLCLKVLLYGYATGVRSSRQLERLCSDSLAYLFLTRGDTPSYRTLCTARVAHRALLEACWCTLLGLGEELGLRRLGRVVLDSTKVRADVSGESVVRASEMSRVLESLREVLREAEELDRREDEEGSGGQTRTGHDAGTPEMRELLRRVRSRLGQEPDPGASEPGEGPRLSRGMLRRVSEAVEVLEEAESSGVSHVSLTDADARMMPGGAEKAVRMCHSVEVAVDKDAGVLVSSDTTQDSSDNSRLGPLVASAARHEPCGVVSVDADSGYFNGEAVSRLEAEGIDLCVPDANTAGLLHRGQSAARFSDTFEYDAQADLYRCPHGNELTYRHQKRSCSGRLSRVYQARRSCLGCPSRPACIGASRTRYKAMHTGTHNAVMLSLRRRFDEPEFRKRYQLRASVVEGVFGFLRRVLGYNRFTLRGSRRVGCEGLLMTLSYQVRKLHAIWAAAHA